MTSSTRSTLPLSAVNELQHDTSPKNIAAARAEIATIVGDGAITDHKDELERHTSTDWSSYPPRPQDEPSFVVFPTSTAQVSEVVKVCHRRRVPVVAFSAGTSLEGHFANLYHGISLDLSRMNKILAVNHSDFDAVVQPGVTYTELNEALAKDNLFFPPDPGPGAMIGGSRQLQEFCLPQGMTLEIKTSVASQIAHPPAPVLNLSVSGHS